MERLVEQLMSLVGALSGRLGSQFDISYVSTIFGIDSSTKRTTS